MELTQVGRRILIQYWWLIGICIVTAVGALMLLERGQPRTYTATARLVLDTQDPTTRQEAAAIADTAKALATSPGQVRAALTRAGVTDRDPAEVARRDVTVQGLGSSGLLELVVRDRSRERAATIANALAAALIRTRVGFTSGNSGAVLTDLDKRLTDLRGRISNADAKIAGLNARVAAASGARGDRLRAARDAAARDRESLAGQQGVLEAERLSLLTAAAARPKPAIVSAATPPADADPSQLPVHLVLAVLLGLILGVGLAGLLETLRPTVVGSHAVAREFDAPLLGTLRSPPDQEAALADLTRVKSRLSLAMGTARIPSVSLLAAGPEIDLGPLAARLDVVESRPRAPAHVPVGAESTSVAGGRADPVAEAPEHRSGASRVHGSAAGDAPSPNGHGPGGIVVVAPSSLKMTEVIETTELLRIVPTAVVGVITYIPSRR